MKSNKSEDLYTIRNTTRNNEHKGVVNYDNGNPKSKSAIRNYDRRAT